MSSNETQYTIGPHKIISNPSEKSLRKLNSNPNAMKFGKLWKNTFIIVNKIETKKSKTTLIKC